MTNKYTIGQPESIEWCSIAELVAKAIPNAVVSKLGVSFGAAFYQKVAEQEYSCAYVARGSSGNIAGVIIGSIDCPKARSIAVKSQLLRLSIAASRRLIRPDVISWLIKSLIARFKDKNKAHESRPSAELIAIAVQPKARGSGLAAALVEKMEKFMVLKELAGPYLILTEKANTRANLFYEKIGAKLIRTNMHHGRAINEWHKEIIPAKKNSD